MDNNHTDDCREVKNETEVGKLSVLSAIAL